MLLTLLSPRAASVGAASGGWRYDAKRKRRILIGDKQYYVNDYELSLLIERELKKPADPPKVEPVIAKQYPAKKAKQNAKIVVQRLPEFIPNPIPAPPIRSALPTERLLASLQRQQDLRAIEILNRIIAEMEDEDDVATLLMMM